MAANSQVIANLFAEIGFKYDKRGVQQTERGLDRLKRRVDSLRQRMSTLSRGLTIAGGVMTGALLGVGRTVYNFEEQLNALRAATNATSEDMGKMREQAIQLGGSTAFSASQAAEGQKLLGQAGYSTQQIIAAMPAVLDLAAAGQIGLGESAAITTSLLNSYNLEAKDARFVSNLLAGAASSAKTTVTEMGVAFRPVAKLAAELNIPLEQTTAILAELQDAGLRAEVSGTGFAAVLGILVNPVGEAKKVLSELNVDMGKLSQLTQEGKIVEAFQMLKKGGLDAAGSMRLFGREQAKVGLTMLGFIDGLKEYGQSLRDDVDASSRQASQQMAGLVGAVKELVSKFETMLIRLGDAGITGWLKTAAIAAQGLINKFLELSPGTKTFIAAIVASGPILLGLGAVVQGLSFALGGLVAIMGLFSVVSFASVIAAGTLIYSAWKPLSTFFVGIWDGFKLGANSAGVAIGNFLGKLFPVDSEVRQLWNSFRTLWDTVQNFFDVDLSATGVQVGLSLWDGVKAAFNSPGKVFDWIVDQWNELVFPALSITLPEKIDNVFDWVSEQWKKAIDVIKKWDMGGVAVSVFTSLSNAIKAIDFSAIGTTIGGLIGKAIVGAASLLTGLSKSLVDVSKTINFKEVGTAIGTLISDALVGSIAGLKGLLTNLKNTVKTINFKEVGTAIGDAISTSVINIVTALSGIAEKMRKTIKGIKWDELGKLIGDALLTAMISAMALLTGLLDKMDKAFKAVDWGKLGESIGLALRNAIVGAWDLLTSLVDKMLKEGGNADWAKLADAIAKWIATAFGSVAEFVGSVLTHLSFGDKENQARLKRENEAKEAGQRSYFSGAIEAEPAPPQNQNETRYQEDDRTWRQKYAKEFLGGLHFLPNPYQFDEGLALASAAPNIQSPGSQVTNQTRTVNVTAGPININADGGDPEKISRSIRFNLEEQLHDAVENVDSPISR